MTDQWTPPRPGAHRRDLFAAFLCDETACNLMRAACLDLGWPVDRINKDRTPSQDLFLPVSVHDLRRTFSSRLNDALFPEALVEACLAHQKKDQVAAAYNHARFSGPRRVLMQVWADMVDCWMRGETAREVIVRGKVKIDAAAHDAEGMNL